MDRSRAFLSLSFFLSQITHAAARKRNRTQRTEDIEDTEDIEEELIASMSVELTIRDLSTVFSAAEWRRLKVVIIRATLRYLRHRFGEMESRAWIVDPTSQPDARECYFESKKLLLDVCVAAAEQSPDDTTHPLTDFSMDCDTVSAFAVYNASGIIPLCQNRQHYFTPGNSLDIWLLLDHIKVFVRMECDVVYNRVYEDVDQRTGKVREGLLRYFDGSKLGCDIIVVRHHSSDNASTPIDSAPSDSAATTTTTMDG